MISVLKNNNKNDNKIIVEASIVNMGCHSMLILNFDSLAIMINNG